jgi:hypothetical protein
VISADDLAHVLGVEARAESAVEPARSQNMTVSWWRSASVRAAGVISGEAGGLFTGIERSKGPQ